MILDGSVWSCCRFDGAQLSQLSFCKPWLKQAVITSFGQLSLSLDNPQLKCFSQNLNFCNFFVSDRTASAFTVWIPWVKSGVVLWPVGCPKYMDVMEFIFILDFRIDFCDLMEKWSWPSYVFVILTWLDVPVFLVSILAPSFFHWSLLWLELPLKIVFNFPLLLPHLDRWAFPVCRKVIYYWNWEIKWFSGYSIICMITWKKALTGQISPSNKVSLGASLDVWFPDFLDGPWLSFLRQNIDLFLAVKPLKEREFILIRIFSFSCSTIDLVGLQQISWP